MSRTAMHADETGAARDPNAPKPEEILAQLRDVLASPAFHGSKRCQQFLEFVCEKALAGDAGSLKERAIAIEVFGRRPGSELGEDTIVRVGAREVRKRLAQYYVTTEGAAASVVIELPSGSYAPAFHYPVTAKQPIVEVVRAEEEALPPKRSRRGLVLAIAVPALAVLAALALARWSADPRETAFQSFWSPVFRSSDPLLIGVGHPIMYLPSHRAALLNAQRMPPTAIPMQRKIELPPDQMTGADFVPVLNQYVGFGDMVAANEVSQMLARRGRPVRVLLASSIPFAELRRSRAYLIGSLSNHWTMELAQNWRFQFAWGPDHIALIKDTQANSERRWTIPAQDDGSTPEDYSLIARVRNSPTGGLLIVSAGIKQFGTEAAGRLLADPIELGTILNKLPKGWEDKNLEIVLHNRVIGNTPAQPEVVASYVW
ncbi:MAG: hypothetical protein ABUS51_10720 [Acidobacteriota bacterium]